MKNFIRKNNKTKAFTLIEALVAISILMIAIASPMTLAQKGLSTAVLSKDQMIASFLAQDAIEAVRNIRDQIAVSQTSGDWLTGNGNQFLKPCICSTPEQCNFDSGDLIRVSCYIDTTAPEWNSVSISSDRPIGHGSAESYKLQISYDTDPLDITKKHFLKYDYLGTEDSKFSRYINIKKNPTGTNPNEAVVNVRVFWDSPQGVQKIDIQNFLYNYSENL